MGTPLLLWEPLYFQPRLSSAEKGVVGGGDKKNFIKTLRDIFLNQNGSDLKNIKHDKS
jgi:hypothetical protein